MELDNWCGYRRMDKLYMYIKEMASVHWDNCDEPERIIKEYCEDRFWIYSIKS
jgi:hypothetical protein